ncbi:MAG: ABC transporter permease [Opitutales bacterium]
MEKKNKLSEIILTIPSTIWLVVFFIIPTILVFTIAFKVADSYGGISDFWTLDTIKNVCTSDYLYVLWRTVLVSALCTLICLVLAVGVGYWIAQQNPKYKNLYLLLIIIPLWTNFLIRIFAWRMVLQPEGFLRTFLLKLGLIGEDTYLLNNMIAVVIVTVYTCLPFAILPIYAASEKFDFSLMEAARDLGASRFTAFRKIFLRGIQRGILTATLVVLVPALGSYAIPDLVGGIDSALLGNKIALKLSAGRNLPEAAALSGLLWLVITLAIVFVLIFSHDSIKKFFKRNNRDLLK